MDQDLKEEYEQVPARSMQNRSHGTLDTAHHESDCRGNLTQQAEKELGGGTKEALLTQLLTGNLIHGTPEPKSPKSGRS